jgi:hypothetical protein
VHMSVWMSSRWVYLQTEINRGHTTVKVPLHHPCSKGNRVWAPPSAQQPQCAALPTHGRPEQDFALNSQRQKALSLAPLLKCR